MIKCKNYHAEYKTDRTCVQNQCRIKELKKEKRKGYGGGIVKDIMAKMPPEYFKIRACDGCKTGERLYKKAKAENRLPSTRPKRIEKIRPERRVHVEMCKFQSQNACVGW